MQGQVCPRCYGKSLSGQVCDGCGPGRVPGPERYLDGLLAACRFEEHSLLQKAIHTLKYEFVRELADPLGELLSEVFLSVAEEYPAEPFILCPLPLHSRRERWRGFNQSELLCFAAVQKLNRRGFWNVRMQQLLERVHFTRPQMELSREQRQLNIEGAFRANVPSLTAVTASTVILVDDIATTLSTLENAAKSLKQAGVERVRGLVLARVF